jgi:DNA-directed RNA polymerase subunit alpha
MPETTTPEQDMQQLLLAGPKDIQSFLQLRPFHAQSPDARRQLERLVVELLENPTLGEQKLSDEEAVLTIGAGLWALGRLEEAVAQLAKASSPEADALTGLCWLETGFADRAIEAFGRADRGKAAVKHLAALGRAEATIKAGKAEAALTDLRALARSREDDPQVHYLLGLAYDQIGRYSDALAAYEKALELNADHGAATFRLAFNAALHGDEEAAREHYEALADRQALYINAVLNLGVLYEDLRDYEKAIACFRRVLKANPTHTRARLFLKDAHASLDMVFDEDRQREIDRQSKLLTIPVSDFEMSIRSRNCLQHMNIYSLGDLVHHTEEELLAWKNFGDTSLHEIKEMLAARGLRLGQTREELAEVPPGAEPGAPRAASLSADEAVLNTSISQLNLSVRSRKCMERLGIVTIGELAERSADELLASRNFGRTSLTEVSEKLAQYGLSLREPEPPEGEEAEGELSEEELPESSIEPEGAEAAEEAEDEDWDEEDGDEPDAE